MDGLNFPGYGDVETFGGRRDYGDDDDGYENWRESVPILQAIGEEEVGEILELIWGGRAEDAADRLAKCYGKAWEAAKKQRRESAHD